MGNVLKIVLQMLKKFKKKNVVIVIEIVCKCSVNVHLGRENMYSFNLPGSNTKSKLSCPVSKNLDI